MNASNAMAQAEFMVTALAVAGFEKFHLDTRIRCADDLDILDEIVIAERAARLAAVVEHVCITHGLAPPAYVIGTEVPPPGGAAHHINEVLPPEPKAALKTITMHREQFQALDIAYAFKRVVALVARNTA